MAGGAEFYPAPSRSARAINRGTPSSPNTRLLARSARQVVHLGVFASPSLLAGGGFRLPRSTRWNC